MDCKHEETTVDVGTHARVCVNCGLVLSESELVDASYLESSTGVYQKTVDDKYWRQFQLMKDLAGRFGLGESVVEQARHVFVQLAAHDVSLVSMGVRGNLTAGICVLLSNRMSSNSAALSLADIASALNESVSSIGQHLKMLKKQAPDLVSAPFSASNHSVYIERFWEGAVKAELNSCKIVISDHRSLLSLAEAVCQIAYDGWLNVGRKPEPIILACLFLALDSVLLGLGKKKSKVFGRKQKTAICQQFSLPHRTVDQRHDELVQFMVSESAGLLPWHVDRNNVLAHLSDIVRVVERVGREVSSDPPSFRASQKHRESMEKRVDAAQLPRSGVEIDEMDLVIEKLLVKQVSKEEIVNCSNLGQLYSLLALHEPILDSD